MASRAVLLAAIAAITLAAWLWLTQGSALFLPHCHQPAGIGGFVSAIVMWQAMAVAMMAPTTLNWLFVYTGLTRRGVGAFLGGYFFVWLGYSVAGAALQMALQHAGILGHDGKLPAVAAGLVLAGAGIVHFTPLSRACLRHCRNPLSYFLEHWDNGPRGGFRFGAAHGAYCVGCCWALMLTGFAMGVMNLVWMGFLTVLISVEKLAPRGDRIAGAAAAGLIVWGAALLF